MLGQHARERTWPTGRLIRHVNGHRVYNLCIVLVFDVSVLDVLEYSVHKLRIVRLVLVLYLVYGGTQCRQYK